MSYWRAGTDPDGLSFLYHSGLFERSIKTRLTSVTPFTQPIMIARIDEDLSHLTFNFKAYEGSV